MGEAVSGKAERFLAEIAAELRQEISAIGKMDSALVERDIAARRREAALGRRWANIRTKIQQELERQGIGEADWCKRELDCDISDHAAAGSTCQGMEAIRSRSSGRRQQRSIWFGLWPVAADTRRTNRYQKRNVIGCVRFFV